MFRKRRSSQKPDEQFYAAFKQSFPDVGPGTTAASEQAISDSAQPRSSSLSEAVANTPTVSRNMDNVDETVKDHDNTPKAFHDQWRLTPSMMDPASFAFSTFTNQTPGYYTPTSGGFNTFYHSSAAGDLHTPGMGINTPLSMPHSISALHATDPSLHAFTHFNPNLLNNAHSFADPFQQQQQHHGQSSQQMFVPPSHFLQHQDSGYSGIDDSPQKATPTQTEMQHLQPTSQLINQRFDHGMTGPNLPSTEKFRFHTTLNAPTAMVRQASEIPITYLNKGQAYTMSIYDTARPNPHSGMLHKYRTYVRISFEDEQQRAKPGACWQLWKEGRGSNEAHQRGGRLLAVEYVDPNQGGDEDLRTSQIELEHASFDGFAVTWYPNNRAPGGSDCSISIRFNFLSTDFSHSKGVKGIPVRLCAKTELLTAPPGSSMHGSEVCFSKVKLFRDHGAERKLSNDVAHVKKSIDKLKQQISQAESGVGNVGKRKRSGSMVVREGGKLPADEDLHAKLAGLQDMFSSTRPLSVLFLRGDVEDDPDLFPVKLPGGEDVKPLQRSATWESRRSGTESPSSNQSPILSSNSSTPKRKFSEVQSTHDEVGGEEASLSPSRPAKLQKRDHETETSKILALDVDASYRPPSVDPHPKPVACFYIRSKHARSPYYRAVYLLRRTVKDLVEAIALKLSIPPDRIAKVTHLNAKGLSVIVDEEVVRQLPEGQDMLVELAAVKSVVPDIMQQEAWALGLNSPIHMHDPKDIDSIDVTAADALELWLNY